MYEFHGWIRLAESPSDIDEGGFDAKLALLQSAVSALDWSNGRAEIMVANGVATLLVDAVPNRRRDEAAELGALIALVIEHFKGAYGIVYEYDEQSRTEYGRGVFSVKVIKRGRCEIALDPFLSPLVPVAEDP